jgi:hypothetical protein
VTAPPCEGCAHLIERLSETTDRLAAATREAAEVHRIAIDAPGVGGAPRSAFTRASVETLRRCNHRDGHELSLGADEALAIETYRECPCCEARLWISVPSVGAILDAAAASGAARVPDLDIELTRREQQVLNVLHRSQYPLRHEQLAALVWSEPDRTHDVRSVLYRLRRKLRTSGWLIPFPPKGRGVRLVRDATEHPQEGTKSDGYEPGGQSDLKLASAA